MTIVEFLTARYEERESGIREALKIEDWGVTEEDLADVAAKRAIVDLCVSRLGDYHQDGIAQDVLSYLASVYKDHPDYRQEWKR